MHELLYEPQCVRVCMSLHRSLNGWAKTRVEQHTLMVEVRRGHEVFAEPCVVCMPELDLKP
jgi:cytochrome c